ncbi:glycosyltransferase family 4 protein [Lentilitoribacter sp. Alg239-R112]|uniref:glycosyltransferase family 4 protein n=1 Tax=Lentilitoribacter sp. Alg239-R112 TaxID=2305987 RepID=UPI0013A705D4|nr:glycosyltransferase family 4 protein [Lentilitoribacter sp. Alg239-R112]
MRLLIISQYFWPESFRINAIVQSLVEKGIEVDVLTGVPNYPAGDVFDGYKASKIRTESWKGAKIFRVPLIPRGNARSWRLAANYFSFIFSGSLFGPWLLRDRRYDAIFVYGLSPILSSIPAIFISKIKRKPLIIWVQDLWPESLSATGHVKSPLILRIVEKVVSWIYRQAHLLLVQSRAFKRPIASLAPDKIIEYYPNSVDPTFAKPVLSDQELPEIPALDEGFSILFAGNIGAAQSMDMIIETAEQLKYIPQIKFVIIGSGSKLEWMRNEVDKRNLENVTLPGWLPPSTMPGLMQKASALIVSLTNEPIFALTVPNKIQAYLAAARPIIASLNGEGAKLVEDAGAGFSVTAEDAHGLKDAILMLYNMPAEQRSHFGINGRKYFLKHFDHEKLVEKLIEKIETTIRKQEID